MSTTKKHHTRTNYCSIEHGFGQGEEALPRGSWRGREGPSPPSPAPSRARPPPAPRPARSARSPSPSARRSRALSSPQPLAPAAPCQGSPLLLLFPASAGKSNTALTALEEEDEVGGPPHQGESAGRGSAKAGLKQKHKAAWQSSLREIPVGRR